MVAGPDTGAVSSVSDEISSLPEGVYRVDVNLVDVDGAGLSNGSGWTGTWTMTIQDGTYAMTCRPIEDPDVDCGGAFSTGEIPHDAVLEAGYVRGSENVIAFVYDADIHSRLTGCELPCFPLPTYEMTWALDGDTLTFGEGPGSYEAYQMMINPWTKVG